MSETESPGRNWWIHHVRDWISWWDPPRYLYRNKLVLSTGMKWFEFVHILANTSFLTDSYVHSNAKVLTTPHAC